MTDEQETIEPEIVEDESPTMSIDVISRAEIDMQIATAKRYPRELAKVKKKMVEMATLDRETAESCYYSLKRWDNRAKKYKFINGESIRLAEIAACCFGNIRAGTRSLGETEDGKYVRQLGMCHDVENNVMIAKEVTRRITTKEGNRFGDDMVGVTMAAASSIALRNAILTVVPRALVKPAYTKAREVALGQTQSLTERRAEVIERLEKLSSLITPEKILGAVDKSDIEEIGWPEVEHLIGLGTAIKEGLQTVEEAFPEPEGRVLTPEDVLDGEDKPEPQEKTSQGQQTIEDAEKRLAEKRKNLRMTEEDGAEVLKAGKAVSVNPVGVWKLIHQDHKGADEWTDLPADYKPQILEKLAEMGES